MHYTNYIYIYIYLLHINPAFNIYLYVCEWIFMWQERHVHNQPHDQQCWGIALRHLLLQCWQCLWSHKSQYYINGRRYVHGTCCPDTYSWVWYAKCRCRYYSSKQLKLWSVNLSLKSILQVKAENMQVKKQSHAQFPAYCWWNIWDKFENFIHLIDFYYAS